MMKRMSEKVPNLVRSLIGVFARNYKYFHAKDGKGYSFVADKIIEIDKDKRADGFWFMRRF